MKKILKIFAIVLTTFAAAIGLVSCGEGQKADVSQYKLTKLPENLQKSSTDLFVYNAADPFISGPVSAGFRGAYEAVGFGKANILDANQDPNTQQTQVDNAISNGSKILVVNSAKPNSADGLLKAAKNANLPIVFFNREMDDAILNGYNKAWFVGTDRQQPGDLQGEFVANQLITNFKAWDKNNDGVIQFALLFGEPGNPEAEGRTKGAKETTQKVFKQLYDKLTTDQQTALGVKDPDHVLQQLGSNLNANWDQGQASQLISGLLATDQKNWPEVIFANNDGMALGALRALNDKGFNMGFKDNKIDLAKTILLTGVDGLPDAQTAVAEGKMSLSVLQDGVKLAAVTTEAAVNALLGKDGFENFATKFPGVKIEAHVKKARVPYTPITIKTARELLKLPAEAQANDFEMPNLG